MGSRACGLINRIGYFFLGGGEELQGISLSSDPEFKVKFGSLYSDIDGEILIIINLKCAWRWVFLIEFKHKTKRTTLQFFFHIDRLPFSISKSKHSHENSDSSTTMI